MIKLTKYKTEPSLPGTLLKVRFGHNNQILSIIYFYNAKIGALKQIYRSNNCKNAPHHKIEKVYQEVLELADKMP